MSTADDKPPTLRVPWTTFGPFPQPLVSLSVQGRESASELRALAEAVPHG